MNLREQNLEAFIAAIILVRNSQTCVHNNLESEYFTKTAMHASVHSPSNNISSSEAPARAASVVGDTLARR